MARGDLTKLEGRLIQPLRCPTAAHVQPATAELNGPGEEAEDAGRRNGAAS